VPELTASILNEGSHELLVNPSSLISSAVFLIAGLFMMVAGLFSSEMTQDAVLAFAFDGC
jgi:hypothetical protein